MTKQRSQEGGFQTRPYIIRIFFRPFVFLCGELSESQSSIIYAILVRFVVQPLIHLGYGSAALGAPSKIRVRG